MTGGSRQTLEEVFQDLERLAKQREGIQTPQHPSQPHMPFEDEVAALKQNPSTGSGEKVCVCGHHPLGLYLKTDGGRSEFHVCPACDATPRCEDCQGTGQLRRFNLLTLKDEVIPGACACRTGRQRADLLNHIGLPIRYRPSTFDTLHVEHMSGQPSQIHKLNDCRKRVFEFCESAVPFLSRQSSAPEKIFLTLLGPVGTGKTHLAAAALKWLVEETGCSARFVDFLFLLSQLRESYSQNSSEERILKPLREADVLLIDELGKGRAEKAWQLEKLDDLLNSRYNEGRITLLTTNYLPPEFSYDPVRAGFRSAPANESFWEQSLPERIGARMYDRIVESSVFVDFIGLPSYRRARADAYLERYRKEMLKES
ncbi:MAG: hypothetical protein RIR26_319 [Pseudomonadota bacterium]|jgi:DNA replication protein DnaC